MLQKIITLIVICISFVGKAQELKSNPSLVIDSLDNGLTYYLYETDEVKNRAIFRLFLKAGSLQETDNQRGLAHFMEHMAFNGTVNFPGNRITDFLESKGAKFGHDLNAHTSYSETIYKLQLPTGDKDLVDSTLTILADWSNGIVLDSLEIEKERGVVLSEWLSKQNTKQETQDAFLNLLLNDSRYTKRKVIGDTTTLRNFKRSDLVDYYKKWYDPNLMAVAIAGDFDLEEVESLIKTKFSGITSQKTEQQIFNIQDFENSNYEIVTDKGTKDIELTGVQLIDPYRDIKTEEDFVAYLKKNILNDLFRERFGNLSFDNPSYKSGSISLGNYFPVKAALMTSVDLKSSAIEEGLEEYFYHVEQIFNYGFTQSEIKKVKKQLLKSLDNSNQEDEKPSAGIMVKEMYQNFYYGNAVITQKEEFRLTKKYLKSIDSLNLKKELERIYQPTKTKYLLTAKDELKDSLPNIATLKKIRDVDLTEVKPFYRDLNVPEKLLARKPNPGSIISEKLIEEIDAKEFTLSNGVRLIYKKTDLDENNILLSGFRKGGYYALQEKDYVNGIYSTPIISLSGYGDFSREALSQFLAGSSAKATMLADKTRTGFYASSDLEDKKTLFELLYLKWTSPKVDTDLFAQVKERTIESKKNEDLSPSQIFAREIKQMLRGDDYVTRSLSAEIIEKNLKESEVISVYNHFFGNADGYTMVLISDKPFDFFREEVTNYLAALPSGKVSLDYKYKLKNKLKEDEKLIKRTGESPKASVSLVYQQSDTIGFLPKRDLENVVVKDIIRSRLLKELREEMGAVYSVGVSSSSTLQPSDLSRQSINFLCEPQRAQELIERTKDILSKLASQEISIEEDLNKIKTNLLKVDNLLRQRNTYWTKAIREHYFNKYPNWNAVVNYQERVQALDEGEIADRIKAYFIDSPTIEAILYPKETNL